MLKFQQVLINIICGYGNEAGFYLVSHPDVNHVVFTGSVAMEKKILHSCADKAIPAIVELGGKSAGIVYPDADLNDVVDSAKHAIFGVAGQICTAMSRLVVHKSVKDELIEKLVDLSKSLKVGPGYEEGSELTPVISSNQLDKVEGYARSGIQQGAEAVHGGKRADREGYFMEATVLNNVTQDMSVAREEIFGPVLSVLEYQDTEEAIAIANDTEYGLGGGVFTKDLNKASWTASKLQAGQVYVNKWFTGSHATPFGGYKQSGYSREKGVDGLKSYLQVKNVGISLN
jgi:NAD-dependent aldehyde dehydrogenases